MIIIDCIIEMIKEKLGLNPPFDIEAHRRSCKEPRPVYIYRGNGVIEKIYNKEEIQ